MGDGELYFDENIQCFNFLMFRSPSNMTALHACPFFYASFMYFDRKILHPDTDDIIGLLAL